MLGKLNESIQQMNNDIRSSRNILGDPKGDSNTLAPENGLSSEINGIPKKKIDFSSDQGSSGYDPSNYRGKHVLPQDYVLTPHLRSLAAEYWANNNRADLVPEREFEKFCLHFWDNEKKNKNWDYCWRTWYVRALDFTRPPRDGRTGLFSKETSGPDTQNPLNI